MHDANRMQRVLASASDPELLRDGRFRAGRDDKRIRAGDAVADKEPPAAGHRELRPFAEMQVRRVVQAHVAGRCAMDVDIRERCDRKVGCGRGERQRRNRLRSIRDGDLAEVADGESGSGQIGGRRRKPGEVNCRRGRRENAPAAVNPRSARTVSCFRPVVADPESAFAADPVLVRRQHAVRHAEHNCRGEETTQDFPRQFQCFSWHDAFLPPSRPCAPAYART